MTSEDSFSGYHPLINLLYFALVLFFSMFFMHPLALGISLLCALSYHIYLRRKKALRSRLVFLLPLLLLTALINPLFNHEGATILSYLPSGNPLTLESIAYGAAAALMLAAVIIWFSSFGAVMSSDKLIYIFGRVIPALSLMLSMALRFIPRFREQIRAVSRAQRALGRDGSGGGVFRRVRSGLAVLSIVLTWSLENAIETADSMKSRGYGLRGRTAFSIYRFDRRDAGALAWLLLCGTYLVVGWASGAVYWRFFPTLKGASGGLYPASVFVIYLALCLTPLLINLKEDRKWTRLKSKI